MNPKRHAGGRVRRHHTKEPTMASKKIPPKTPYPPPPGGKGKTPPMPPAVPTKPPKQLR
jgi:hypothetical protein